MGVYVPVLLTGSDLSVRRRTEKGLSLPHRFVQRHHEVSPGLTAKAFENPLPPIAYF